MHSKLWRLTYKDAFYSLSRDKAMQMEGTKNKRMILDFKLSPCCIDDEFSFGYFPGVL